MNKNLIQVVMFGRFELRVDDKSMSAEDIHSDQITKLLAYILINHTKKITVQELSDILWDEEDSSNRAGALKNLMYRMRTTLRKYLGDHNFILTGRGTYCWNEEIGVQLDCEIFEKFCHKGNQLSGMEQLKQFEKAQELYQGSLLPILASEHWVIPLATYYHSDYLVLTKKVAHLYAEYGKAEEMEAICRKAIGLEPLDEELHYLLIVSLAKQGKNKMGIKQYTEAVDILYENLGIRPSKKLQKIYEELLKETNEQELDLGTIQQDLLEATKPEGVFICEYGIFREIYRLQARQAQRLGMSVYISLLTLEPPVYIEKGSDEYLAALKEGMSHVEKSLKCLRAGDVASKYSGAQYVILLPTCTFETGKMVVERVMDKFFNRKKWGRYSIRYSLDEIGVSDIIY